MTNEELIKNHSAEMIEKTGNRVVSKDTVEVRFEFEGNEQWSVISMHNYERQGNIFKTANNNRFELYFGYYDDEDEFLKFSKPQTGRNRYYSERVTKVMSKVLADERGMRLPGNFLSDKKLLPGASIASIGRSALSMVAHQIIWLMSFLLLDQYGNILKSFIQGDHLF